MVFAAQRRVVFLAQANVTLAQFFYSRKYALAGLRRQYFAKQVTEQAHAGTQFLVAGGRGHTVSHWCIHY